MKNVLATAIENEKIDFYKKFGLDFFQQNENHHIKHEFSITVGETLFEILLVCTPYDSYKLYHKTKGFSEFDEFAYIAISPEGKLDLHYRAITTDHLRGNSEKIAYLRDKFLLSSYIYELLLEQNNDKMLEVLTENREAYSQYLEQVTTNERAQKEAKLKEAQEKFESVMEFQFKDDKEINQAIRELKKRGTENPGSVEQLTVKVINDEFDMDSLETCTITFKHNVFSGTRIGNGVDSLLFFNGKTSTKTNKLVAEIIKRAVVPKA